MTSPSGQPPSQRPTSPQQQPVGSNNGGGGPNEGDEGFKSGIEGKIAVILIVLFMGGYLFLIFALKSEPDDRHVKSWLNELDRRVTNRAGAHPAPPAPTNAAEPAGTGK